MSTRLQIIHGILLAHPGGLHDVQPATDVKQRGKEAFGYVQYAFSE
jgi:hypothetical protein